MANKIVLGAASLGVAGYYLSESLKDLRVRQEVQERQQQLQDCLEEREETITRAAREREVDVAGQLHTLVQDKMMEIIEQIQRESERVARERQRSSLTLPLLSGDNEPSEVVLGGALALSHRTIVNTALEVLCTPTPGLARAKLSGESVKLICNVFQSHCIFNTTLTIKDISPLFMLAVYDSKAQSGLAVVRPLRVQTTDTRRLFEMARDLNLYLIPESRFRKERVFGGTSTGQKYKLVKSNQYFLPKKGDRVFLMNFSGDFFTPGCFEDDRLVLDFSNVRLCGKVRPTVPNRKVAVNTTARFVASDVASIAASRLEGLSSRTSSGVGLSLEHIAVECGYDVLVLHEIADNERYMIETNGARIASTITRKLEMCVPSPEEAFNVDAAKEGSVTEALKVEISTFVGQYMQLLNLSHCEIPRLRGLPPSACVTEKKRVYDEAFDAIFVCRKPMVRRTRRILEKEERERLIRSRQLSAPSKFTTAVFLCAWCLLSFWLSYAGLHKFLPAYMVRQGLLIKAISLAFGLWLAYGLLMLLQHPLRVDEDGSASSLLWNVGAALAEALVRKARVMLGLSLPFDSKIQHLRELCSKQHHEWMLRIGRREYYNALRRKKITFSTCALLLEAFTEAGAAEGVLPGRDTEAEAFLQLEIEEESTTEDKKDEDQSKLAAFNELTAEIESSFQFSRGDRVFVKVDWESRGSADQATSQSKEIVLLDNYGRKASVVDAMPAFYRVQFDGERSPVLVPAKACQRLNAFDDLDNDDSVDSRDSEPSDGAAIGNDDDTGLNEDECSDEDAGGSDSVEEDLWHKRKKARTVEEALEDGGWKIVRQKNHICFKRIAQFSDGGPQEQHFTMAKTPSDRRSHLKALSTLNKLNETGASSAATDGHSYDCTVCSLPKPEVEFSKSQIKKGTLKCKLCVAEMQQVEKGLKRQVW